jgi:hypothetical protein
MNSGSACRGRGGLLAAVTALACAMATSAFAEIHIEGNPGALRLSASGDALSDVLSALGTSWPVKYRSSSPLDAPIEGAYSGSLSQVVARLLDDYNYVIKQDAGRTEIVVFGRRGEAAIAPALPSAQVPASRTTLSRWR